MQVGPIAEKVSNDRDKRKSSTGIDVKDAVLAGLSHFATGAALEALVYLLEVEHSVDFALIADNPAVLRRGLTAMFGSTEEVVEARICQALATQFGVIGPRGTLEELISMIRASDPASSS